MYYKEQLEKAQKYGVLNVANEVDVYFEAVEINLNEEEFENVCGFIQDCYVHSEYSSVANCVKAMASIIQKAKEKNANVRIEKIIDETSKWDLLDVASYYD